LGYSIKQQSFIESYDILNMPSREDILKAFDRINVWSRGSERAPHKPLLVLYALGQLSRGGPNLVAFRDLAPKLNRVAHGVRADAAVLSS
jgi:hypothetical protein